MDNITEVFAHPEDYLAGIIIITLAVCSIIFIFVRLSRRR